MPSPGASARSSFALERAGIEANRLSLEAFNEAYNASTRGGRAPEPISQQAYSSLELPEDNGPLDMLRVMLGIPDEIRDQFAALCTLPPQTPAPATTLAKLWGVREDEVSPTLTTLAEKGVLSMAQLPNGQIWALPQGERLELLQNATREVASMYHARLIDAYARDALEKQADVQEHTLIDRIQDAEVQARALALVPDDGYSLANLAHHLMGAERLATARAMLLDPEWLERKLRACGAAAVVADFRRYLLVSPGKDVKLVLEAFQMSVGLMTSHNDVPGLLRCLMASRLMTVPLSAHMQRWLAAQKEAMRKDAERAAAAGRACCLPAQTPSLDQTGGLQRLALKGHKGAVTKVLLTPSGCDAVSASADGTVRVWDLEIGDCVLVLEGHARAITDMAITADGSLLVTTSEDGTARAYEMEQGQCLRVLAGHEGGITSLALDPYGRFVVTGSSDGTARVWDLASARSLHTLSSPDSSVCSVALSPCTRYALLGCSDGGVRLFDVISGQLMGSMLGHTAEVSAVAFSKDGKRCLSASHDGTLRTWSLKSGSLKRNMDGRAGRIDAIIVSPNGKLAVAGYEDGSVRLWELVTGTCIKVLQGHKQWVSTVAMSPSGERLLTASADGTAIAWNTDTGEVVRVLEGHSGAVLSAAITQRGRFAVTTSEDGSVRVWDFAASSSHTPKWHAGRIRALTAHDGLVVATAGEDCVARLWDGALGEYRGLLQGHAVPIRWSMFARDGTRLVTASPDRTVCVWDVQTMELLHKLPGETRAGGVERCTVPP